MNPSAGDGFFRLLFLPWSLVTVTTMVIFGKFDWWSGEDEFVIEINGSDFGLVRCLFFTCGKNRSASLDSKRL